MSHPWLLFGAALVAGGVAALSWTVRRTWPRLALGIAEALADSRDTGMAPIPLHQAIDDMARTVGVLTHGGGHDDLPLTVRQRLDQIAELEAIPVLTKEH